MKKQFYNAQDVADLLQVSKSKGYQLIKQMNEELASKGFIVVNGRVPAAYVSERFFGVINEIGGSD